MLSLRLSNRFALLSVALLLNLRLAHISEGCFAGLQNLRFYRQTFGCTASLANRRFAYKPYGFVSKQPKVCSHPMLAQGPLHGLQIEDLQAVQGTQPQPTALQTRSLACKTVALHSFACKSYICVQTRRVCKHTKATLL